MTSDLRVKAKKSLGQNFLVNSGVADRIIAAAKITLHDTVLEVGPGTGVLTQRLTATGARIIAVEKDRSLVKQLKQKFTKFPNVHIVEGDILEFDPADYQLTANSYKLVSNIPYYLTSHLLRRMLEMWHPPSRAVLMVQVEVAHRMMAVPPDMNLLALSIQLYSIPSIVMRVSRGSFRPAPNVDSAVIKLEVRMSNDEVKKQNKKILEVARKAFGQKRKQLKATIPAELLIQAGIEPSMRPQELTVEQWKMLAGAVE